MVNNTKLLRVGVFIRDREVGDSLLFIDLTACLSIDLWSEMSGDTGRHGVPSQLS